MEKVYSLTAIDHAACSNILEGNIGKILLSRLHLNCTVPCVQDANFGKAPGTGNSNPACLVVGTSKTRFNHVVSINQAIKPLSSRVIVSNEHYKVAWQHCVMV